MSYDFKFAGRSLSDLYGVTTKRPDIEVAEYDGELHEIPGRSGDEFRDNKRYFNVPMKRNIGFAQRPSARIPDLADQLIDWLGCCHGYQEFEDTDHPGMVTYAVLRNFDRIQIQLRRYHTATLQFSRVPFWFQKTGLKEIEYTTAQGAAGVTLNNPFPMPSQLLIRLRLSSNQSESRPEISVSLNGLSFECRCPLRPAYDDSSFIIDTESLQAYLKNNTSGNITYVDADVSEDFVLTTGANTLQLLNTANVYKLYITPRWRRL